jgi:opacity protein-like surface antigen
MHAPTIQQLSVIATAIAVAAIGLAAPVPVAFAADEPAGAVAGERVIRRLGGSTRFSPPVRTVDELKAMATTNRADLETILGMAGLGNLSGQVIEALTTGAVTDYAFAPGGRLEWMALRRRSGLDLIRPARWGGDEPFDAFRFTVATPEASYDFVVPKVCGNLSLVAVTPKVAAPVPPPPPPAEPVPPPPPPVAASREASPWYVGGDVGYVDISDGSYDFAGAAVIPHRAEFDGGTGYFAQVGRAFGQARVELELGRRENDADRFGSINNITPARGAMNATSLMVNALYDFPVGERFVPYLGVGIGGAEVEADKPRKAVTDPARTGALLGDDNRFAWQLLAGVAFRLNEHWALKLDYRYFDAGDADLNYGVGCDAGGGNCIFVGSLDESYDAHSISAGARYNF